MPVADPLLARICYQVLTAANGEEAIRIFECRTGVIGLLITDITMPQMGGRELATLIMRMPPGIKVLYISGLPANVLSLQDVPDRGNAFLQKPFTLDNLARQVGVMLSIS